MEVNDIKSVFALSIDSEYHNYLLVSLIEETHLLRFDYEELHDTQLKGFFASLEVRAIWKLLWNIKRSRWLDAFSESGRRIFILRIDEDL